MNRFLRSLLFFSCLLAISTRSKAAFLAAPSAALADVQATVSQASPGDTVIVPAAIVAWIADAKGDCLVISKGITLKGATTTNVDAIPADKSGGTTAATYHPVDLSPSYNDQTVLLHTSGHMIHVSGVPPTQQVRITGFTFRGGLNEKAMEGIVFVDGISNAPNHRVDHCHFDNVAGKDVWVSGAVLGVAHDNVHEDKPPSASYQIWMNRWGGKANGDQSWAEPNYAGSDQFFFVEHNIIANRGPFKSAQTNANLDGRNGSRAVVRYNKFYNTVGPNTHGTESLRGHRFYEVYNNNFQWDWPAGGGQMRSGGIYLHDNAYTGVMPQHGVGLMVYREDANWANMGGTTGLNPCDINDYDANGNIKPPELTGTAALDNPSPATRNGGGKLTVSGPDPGWNTGKWIGHFVANLSQNSFSNGGSIKNRYTSQLVTSSGSNWIKTDPVNTPEFQPGISWKTGDHFEIRKVIAALDQSGRGGGDYVLTAGAPLNSLAEYNLNWTNPTHHNNQPLEPCYSWNNIHSPGGQHFGLQSPYPTINEGVEYFNKTPAPNYTPYVYPHPLTLSGTPSPTPSPSATPTPTPPPSPSPTPTATPTPSPSPTVTPSASPTASPTPIATPSPSPSVTPSATPTVSPTPDPSASPASGLASLYPGDKNIASDPAVILADDFESYTSPSQLTTKWTGARPLQNLRIATESGNVFAGNKSLEMSLPISTSETVDLIRHHFSPEQDTVFIRSYCKFDPGYSVSTSNHNGLNLQAKYPGAGRTPPADGTGFFLFLVQNNIMGAPDPGESAPGFTHIYAYWPHQRTNYGDHWYPNGNVVPSGAGDWLKYPNQYPDFKPLPNFLPQRDRWYCYELMVKANTPGKNDGEVKYWIDGKVVSDFPDLNMRSISTLKIDEAHIELHALHSERVNKKWYDNVVIATKYIGPMASAGPSPSPTITPSPSPSPNLAPIAHAGADKTIRMPNSVALYGSASDDGLPNPPGKCSFKWSKASGPGAVNFGAQNSLTTKVSFSQRGTYVLKLTVSDGALSSSDSVTVTVRPRL